MSQEPAQRRLAAKTLDLLSFLDRVARPPALPEARGAPVVAYHSFCQSTNVLGLGPTGARLLWHAGFPVADLPEGEVCCGFGGSTSLNYPEVAGGIVERKLARLIHRRHSRQCHVRYAAELSAISAAGGPVISVPGLHE